MYMIGNIIFLWDTVVIIELNDVNLTLSSFCCTVEKHLAWVRGIFLLFNLFCTVQWFKCLLELNFNGFVYRGIFIILS